MPMLKSILQEQVPHFKAHTLTVMDKVKLENDEANASRYVADVISSISGSVSSGSADVEEQR
jgi:hypothetical protein